MVKTSSILDSFTRVREASLALIAPLSHEDMVVQSMPDVSPTKWHLAHTTWFWETFLLGPQVESYKVFDPQYNHLFNSYYERVGARHARAERGLLTRPGLEDVLAYRAHVDEAMERLMKSATQSNLSLWQDLIELGLAHEQQHQELLLTDIKHVLSRHPFSPAMFQSVSRGGEGKPIGWVDFSGGVIDFGYNGNGFSFDNEGPRHQAVLTPFALADRPVTNGEYLEFINDGGYENPLPWLSDGWAKVQSENWKSPLYWKNVGDAWREFTLHGEQALDLSAPVVHLSYYEAAAFADWAGARLPEEREWEHAATSTSMNQSVSRSEFSPHPKAAREGDGLKEMFGGVWEWTRSSYSPYPRYKASKDAVGEYNGKFMCGQFVLKGGSCATSDGHIRATYRNFFPPEARWQFSGLRLARDI